MEWISGNVFIRPNTLAKAGESVGGHMHNFDHTTIVFSGSLRVNATLPDGTVIEREFTAPSHFLVKRDVLHAITALEDHTVYWCIYSHRTPQGDVVQEWNGWLDATR